MNKCYFDIPGNCMVLKQKRCKDCTFYMTYTELKLSRQKALRRLKTLDKPTRMAIAEKYGVEGIV